MLKNYFKTLFRNMQKNKLHASINIIGMTVAFACGTLLLLMVWHEFSFDRFHENKSRLYKIYREGLTDKGFDRRAGMAYPFTPALKAENIGAEKATRIMQRGTGVRYMDKTLDHQIMQADNDFFSMFSFKILDGSKQHPLASLNDIVLSKQTAESLFGKENPIGKNVEINQGTRWLRLTVSAVVEDPPKNSSFDYGVITRVENSPDYAEQQNNWNFGNHETFILLNKNVSKADFEKRLTAFAEKSNPEDTAYLAKTGYLKDNDGRYIHSKLLPLTDVHFDNDIGSGSAVKKSYLYVLLLVACVILLIACFNFINLNLGIAFTRAKEIGIRKCLGAGKREVLLQIWGENLAAVLISFLLGTLLSIVLIKQFNQIFAANIDAKLLLNPYLFICLLLLILLVSFIASGYPSYIMSNLKVVEVLKSKVAIKSPGFFRNALIVSQFVIAIALICCTIIIYQQFQHLRNAPLGYNTQQIISIPIKDVQRSNNIINKMKAALQAQPSVESITGSSINLGRGKDGNISDWNWAFDYNGKPVETNVVHGNFDFAKTLGLKLKEGRDFSSSYISDTANAVIVTESFIKQMGEKNGVGVQFYMDTTKPKLTIVGVVPDFQLYSMYAKRKSVLITIDPKAVVPYILVRVNAANANTAMNLVKNAYAIAEPGAEFIGSFVNENTDRWYSREQRLSKMFSAAALVAIILSCMGLFGMAFIIINQRVKEIGVRKVLGASVSGIAALVSKEFIRPVIIAMFIAVPIAVFAMRKWLQDFDYRVSIHWWVFAIGGVLAILIAIVTVSFQAIKAATANPVKSLRTE